MTRLAYLLLALLVAGPAHAADQLRTYTVGPNTYSEGTAADGTRWRSRSWQDGPNRYTETTGSDGRKMRCRSWQTGQNTYEECD